MPSDAWVQMFIITEIVGIIVIILIVQLKDIPVNPFVYAPCK